MWCIYYRKNHHEPWTLIETPVNKPTIAHTARYASKFQVGHIGLMQWSFGVQSFWVVPKPHRWFMKFLCKQLLVNEGWYRRKANGRYQWIKIDPRQLSLFRASSRP